MHLKSVRFSHRKVVGSVNMRRATDASRAQCDVPVKPYRLGQGKTIPDVKKQLLNVVSK